jgi:hypothetical protein
MKSQRTQPVTWQWLERELASRLSASKGRAGASKKPLVEILDHHLRRSGSMKQTAQRAFQEQRT